MQQDDCRTDLPVSRGQWRAIATHALQLLDGTPVPASRYDATVILTRLAESAARHADQRAGHADARPAGGADGHGG